MKYIKTFEYQIYTTSGTLGKMYPGRFTDTLSRHCMMLDRRGIEYELFVDEDELKGNQDVVFIVIKDDYKQEYFTIFKSLGFRPINTKQIKDLTKFNSMQDYLKTKTLDEKMNVYGVDTDYNSIYPVDDKGFLIWQDDSVFIKATDDEITELKKKNLVRYEYSTETDIGQWEYKEDDLDEIEEELELIRSADKYNV